MIKPYYGFVVLSFGYMFLNVACLQMLLAVWRIIY